MLKRKEAMRRALHRLPNVSHGAQIRSDLRISEGVRASRKVRIVRSNGVGVTFARLYIYLALLFDFAITSYAAPMYAGLLAMALLGSDWTSVRKTLRFAPLMVVITLYICLSYAHALDSSWTNMRLDSAIPRQTIWVFTLPVFTMAAINYFKNVFSENAIRELIIVLGLMCLNLLISGVLVAHRPDAYSFFGYLWAPLCIFLSCLSWSVILRGNRLLYLFTFALALCCIAVAHSSQNKVVYISLLLMVFLGHRNKWLAALFYASMFTFIVTIYAWAWTHPAEASAKNPDMAVRAMMAKNAWAAFVETKLTGVGYGTEAIKNVYPEIGVRSFQSLDSSFIFIGNHNAFFDLGMRTGLAGLLALIFLVLSLLSGQEKPKLFAYKAFLGSAIVLNLSVNVALQSPFHAVGICCMIGASVAASLTEERTLERPKRHLEGFSTGWIRRKS